MCKKLINCDLGECLSPSPDEVIMPLINRANIACGGHVGDNQSMIKTIRLAQKHKVMIGAHLSYADFDNFGRKSVVLSQQALFELLYKQLTNFHTLCMQNHAKLEYIKPHGALYHDMSKKSVFKVLCKVMGLIDKNLALMVPLGFKGSTSITLLHEVFADRVYRHNQLLPRRVKGSVLDNSDEIVAQYQQFKNKKNVDSICFHSDNSASVEALKQVKNA